MAMADGLIITREYLRTRQQPTVFDLLLAMASSFVFFPALSLWPHSRLECIIGAALASAAFYFGWPSLRRFDWRMTLSTMRNKGGDPRLSEEAGIWRELRVWVLFWAVRWLLYCGASFASGVIIAGVLLLSLG